MNSRLLRRLKLKLTQGQRQVRPCFQLPGTISGILYLISYHQESRDELRLKKSTGVGGNFKQDMVLVDKTVADRQQVTCESQRLFVTT